MRLCFSFVSVALIVSGIVLCTFGVGGILGGVLVGAGAGSLINGYVNENADGNFISGWIGGAVSGALCGAGAGLGGMSFAAASETANLVCVGNLALGALESFVGGFAGNLLGSLIASSLDDKKLDLKQTINDSIVLGSLNLFAGIGSSLSYVSGNMIKTAVDLNNEISLKIISGFLAGATEASYDSASYLITNIFPF